VVEEATLEVWPDIYTRTGISPNIANLATLVGLLRTNNGPVSGLCPRSIGATYMKSQLLSSGSIPQRLGRFSPVRPLHRTTFEQHQQEGLG